MREIILPKNSHGMEQRAEKKEKKKNYVNYSVEVVNCHLCKSSQFKNAF